MSDSDPVTEALLEIYFTRAVAKVCEMFYGAHFLRFWKPSPGREARVGFDQGWICYTGTNQSFETSLQQAIKSRRTSLGGTFYVGYFMQYKRVRRISKTSKFTEEKFRGEHYRSEIDLCPNSKTQLSQHETLCRLAQIRDASVSYACGMLFDANAIYDKPNLGRLRIVPVDSGVIAASAQWIPSDRHFIAFKDERSPPVWCSKPFEGRTIAPEAWVREQVRRDAEGVLKLLHSASEALRSPLSALPQCLTVLEFSNRRPRRRWRTRYHRNILPFVLWGQMLLRGLPIVAKNGVT
jgi:hypothetical protein